MIINCPKCGKKTAMLNDICEHCGAKVKKCPECENTMEQSQNICDYCGYAFAEVVQEAKDQQEIPNELKKTAANLAAFAEQENKKYKTIGKITEIIGMIFFILALIVISNSLSGEDIISRFDKGRTIFIALGIIGIVLTIVGEGIKDFKSILSFGAIDRQIVATKFDYENYYSYDEAIERIKKSVLTDQGDFQLAKAIHIKEDTQVKTNMIIKEILFSLPTILFDIFILIGVIDVIDGLFLSKLFEIDYKFKFTTPFIVASVCFGIGIVMGFCFTDYSKEDALAHVKKFKK